NFVPTTVATKSGQVLVNAAKQNSTTSTSTARPKVNTAAIRLNVNAKSSYFKPYFPKRRHFNQRLAAKTNTFSRKNNTAKGKIVTTAGPKAVVNAAKGKKETFVKTLAGLARMGYEKPSHKLTFYKAYFPPPQWKFMIHIILQCLSAKTTVWNEFSSTMTSAIICLADNQKFNFSKYIFDNMVKSLEGRVKFYMFPRFLQVFLDKKVEGMARHKEIYVISSHTKKIFANMRRIGAGFSRVITPLFDSMMVPVAVDMEDEDHVLTPSSDPLPSSEDSSILNELMVFYTSLQEQSTYFNANTKAAQAKEIAALKKKVFRRVKSHMEKDGLGAQEDASKQGRMIEEIDQNAKIALDDETQGRTNDDEMFRVDDLAGEEVVAETTTGIKDSAAPTTDVTEEEITIAQALTALKSVKTKVVQSQIPTVSSSKDKGKAKMIEPEVPLKKKEHMRIDEEYARKLQAEEQEAARLSRAQ
nr:hypothetical protein [Tanacetum cinerariifolium]